MSCVMTNVHGDITEIMIIEILSLLLSVDSEK